MGYLLFNVSFFLFVSFICFFLLGKTKQTSDRKIKNFLIYAFFQLLIFHVFLDPFKMNDLPGYIETFDLVCANPLKESLTVGYVGVKMELGWMIFCKILSLISNNYFILILASGVIIVGCYMVSIYRFSYLPWLSVFLFLCTTFNQSLFVLRQHVAIALCLFSLQFVINRDLKKFLFVLCISISFHLTALVFFPFYWIYKVKINKLYWICFILTLLLSSYLVSYSFQWAFSNLWYNSYADNEGSNLTLFLIQFSSFALYLIASNGRVNSDNKIEKCFFLLCCIGLILTFAGQGFSPTNRLAKYFTISDIFLIPIAFKKIRTIGIRFLLTCIILFSYLLFLATGSNAEYVSEYKLIFI